MHGEYIWGKPYIRSTIGSPPYARGIPVGGCGTCVICRITPVCTGNTRRNGERPRLKRDHPRMHGEYMACTLVLHANLGSPPYARGIRVGQTKLGLQMGITPVCTGNTNPFQQLAFFIRDHPRMHGEYRWKHMGLVRYLGSPPYARGIR